jgi:hypothetical protein
VLERRNTYNRTKIDVVLTCAHTGTINFKESLFLTTDKQDTVEYKWRDPPEEWDWQTAEATFARPNHLSYTYTHLVDAMTQISPAHTLSPDSMYPVYIPGEVSPPAFGQSIWFTLTAATPTLKGLLFPKFFDSEMGQDYALSEEPRDQEHL